MAAKGNNKFNQAPQSTIGPFAAVVAGNYHTCAIKKIDATLSCWGSNADRQQARPAGTFAAFLGRTLFDPTIPIRIPTIQAHTAYRVIPEGMAAAISFQPDDDITDGTATLGLSKTGDGASRARLSDDSITLSLATSQAQVMVAVADNSNTQGSALTFTIAFTLNKGTLDGAAPDLPQALIFTIPPNDLKADYKEDPPAIITGASTTLELVIADLASKKVS